MLTEALLNFRQIQPKIFLQKTCSEREPETVFFKLGRTDPYELF